ATNQIAQTGLSSLPPVIYYSEQLFSGYTWRLALYKYHLSRDEKINCELLSKDKTLQKRFNFPEDEESRRRRSIDIYFWLRDIIANKGLVYRTHKLTYQIKTGCKLKNKINSITDLL
ncbi:hypothetical protein, partial [Aeromonas veronii]